MAFIDTVPPHAATGEVHALYESTRKHYGSVPNWALAFSHRPEVMRAWGKLIATVRSNLTERHYELVTVAAARAIRNSYCSLAHSERLLGKYFTAEQMTAIAGGDYQAAGLSPADIALIQYAEAVATRAHAITQADIDRLREHGFSDVQIFDAASAAAARCFFSKLLDAVGAEPDASFRDMDASVRDPLTVGRAIAASGEDPPAP